MDNNRLSALARKLHALMGSDNQGEREAARVKLRALLAKHKLTWNDLPGLLSGDIKEEPADVGPDDYADQPAPPALDLIEGMLARHLHLNDHELTALTLWCAHTFFYQQFSITPRLALLSPVRGCGKSTVLSLLASLAFKARKFDHTTPAGLFHIIDREHRNTCRFRGS
jgi:hypothetical protein